MANQQPNIIDTLVEHLPALPKSEDEKFWDGERIISNPIDIPICQSHTKEGWAEHVGYVDNHDGSISCKFCPWGTKLAGYYRLWDDYVVDLRKYGSNEEQSKGA